MNATRREFLKKVGLAGAAVSITPRSANSSTALQTHDDSREFGVLVDIPNCVGCRKCEFACREANGFGPDSIEAFDDKSVFARPRRPEPDAYTVVNRFNNPQKPSRPAFVKANCLHCLDPACASACLVGALRRQEGGVVTYDAKKCMGCRYCMVACPFGIPAYEYDNALTPQVRKCTFCFERLAKDGGVPACVKICPQECLVFGKRREVLALAREKVAAHPGVYQGRIYGEHEAGGTAWVYIAGQPFEELGFPKVGSTSPARLTEAIQHGVFKYFIPPLALYGLLGVAMRLMGRTQEESASRTAESDAPSNCLTGIRRDPARDDERLQISRTSPASSPCPSDSPTSEVSV